MRQFVFAGLATTKHLTSFFATFSRAYPYAEKIFPFIAKRSFLSMPYLRGNPPRKIPTSASLKITSGSEPISIDSKSLYAPS